MVGPMPYQLEGIILDAECLRLLQIIHSSSSLHHRALEMRNNAPKGDLGAHLEPGSMLYLLAGEEVEASRIILNLAVVIRNHLDHLPLEESEDATVSELLDISEKTYFSLTTRLARKRLLDVWQDQIQNTPVPATIGLRETCNKIIHARGVEWGRELIAGGTELMEFGAGENLSGDMYVIGDRSLGRGRSQYWLCKVSAERFCLRGCNNY